MNTDSWRGVVKDVTLMPKPSHWSYQRRPIISEGRSIFRFGLKIMKANNIYFIFLWIDLHGCIVHHKNSKVRQQNKYSQFWFHADLNVSMKKKKKKIFFWKQTFLYYICFYSCFWILHCNTEFLTNIKCLTLPCPFFIMSIIQIYFLIKKTKN